MPRLLMVPGPTPLSQAVREAQSRPAVSHRSAEYKVICRRVFAALQWAFQTKHPVLVFTSNATGAVEAAMRNTCNPGDAVLTLNNGFFSERWGRMAQQLGYDTTVLTVPEGQAHTAEQVKAELAKKQYHAVVITHSETATGVMCDLQSILQVVQEAGALSIVDAVTSVGISPLPMDDWGADVVIGASQKGFMSPPGLTFVGVGPRGWKAFERAQYPGVAFNFEICREFQTRDMPPFTPATHTFFAVDVSLQAMQAEGLSGIHARHRRNKLKVREQLSAMGCRLLVPNAEHTCDAVTVAYPPQGWTSGMLREALLDYYGIEAANGAGGLMDHSFRIGHLGTQRDEEVNQTLAALHQLLNR